MVSQPARVLVVHHSPTPAVRRLATAVLAGTRDDALEGVEVVEHAALDAATDAGADAVAAAMTSADGVLLVTPANFGYMSGALKHVFDAVFLRAGGALADDGAAAGGSVRRGVPYGLLVHGRYDTTGAVRSVQAIAGALPWRQAAEVVEVLGDVTAEHEAAAHELGGTIAALALESSGRR